MVQVTFSFENVADLIDMLGPVLGQADGTKPKATRTKKETTAAAAPAATPVATPGETVDFDFGTGGDDLAFLGDTPAPKLTVEMIREKASGIAKQSEEKKQKVLALVKHHKVPDLSSLPEASYQTFYDQLDKIK